MTRLSDDVIGHLRDVATWPELPPDRYVVRRPLGRGGMGAVFAAYDEVLGREVAVKIANTPISDDDLERRLRQEARVLAQLEHPGIVPVHDAGVLADGRWFYVMKLVRGETLTGHLTKLSGEAAVLSVFERIAETVAFAHAAGIIHRDLKPSNVMVGTFGEVLVLDWGVAKVLGTSSGDAPAHLNGKTVVRDVDDGGTASGTRIGTVGFMAPEQQRGDASAAGPPADIFSLGALLFWMLTGSPAPRSLDAAAQTLTTSPARPPRRLRAVVLKSLAPEPRDRYSHAGELVEDLARYRAGNPVGAHRETPFEQAGAWFGRYRTFILLIAAYLIMRTLFALLRQ